MKKLFGFIFALMLFASCSRIDAGYVGVKVKLLGSEKGVQQEVLGVGRYYIGINEELYRFPVFQVNYVYTADDTEGSPTNEEFTFQTNEGMGCGVDLGVAMTFQQDKVSAIFQKYRKGPDEIRSVIVRNSIRDALNKIAGNMPVESVYGAGKSLLIDSVTQVVRAELAPNGIYIDKISLIGAIRIPESVKEALDAKVKMTQEAQQKENEIAKAQAQAAIDVAKAQGIADARKIEADGEAYYNKTVASSLTPSIVELKWIAAWEKGGSNVPTYLSGSGASNFMMNMK